MSEFVVTGSCTKCPFCAEFVYSEGHCAYWQTYCVLGISCPGTKEELPEPTNGVIPIPELCQLRSEPITVKVKDEQ